MGRNALRLAIEAMTEGIASGSARDLAGTADCAAEHRRSLRAVTRSVKPLGLDCRNDVGVAECVAGVPTGAGGPPVRHPVTSALRRTHVTSRLTTQLAGQCFRRVTRPWPRPDNVERDEPYIHNAVTWVTGSRRS
jgi:hypothetical protein